MVSNFTFLDIRLGKIMLFCDFRFNSCFYSAVKANVVCKNGSCHNRIKVKRRLLESSLQIFWQESPKCARFWSGKISKSFINGNLLKMNCLFYPNIWLRSCFFPDMLVCIFVVLSSNLIMNWSPLKWFTDMWSFLTNILEV